jgi:hypothetical protein
LFHASVSTTNQKNLCNSRRKNKTLESAKIENLFVTDMIHTRVLRS